MSQKQKNDEDLSFEEDLELSSVDCVVVVGGVVVLIPSFIREFSIRFL